VKRRLFIQAGLMIPFLSFLKNPRKAFANSKELELPTFPSSLPGKTITIASRKGGVGNTVITGNLGICLAEQGHSVLVIDTGYGGGICTTFGIEPSKWSIDDVREKRTELDNLFSVSSPRGIKVLNVPYEELIATKNIKIISKIFNKFDVRLVDVATANTIPGEIMGGPIVGEIVILATPEPAAVTEAYAMLKHIVLNYPEQQNLKFLVNQVYTDDEGKKVHLTLEAVAQKYLGRGIPLLGSIEEDRDLRRSVGNQKSVIKLFPDSKASKKLYRLALQLVPGEIQLRKTKKINSNLVV
jgi:flagellar biosynthesis protein FlhG